ncbi:MAG: TAXI family TRAP transporter solute-binding subunit [Alphaproteobacteria bacterium]|nr:TAXI family TRAP transporter solute-binding subunit [Alphaproteobacteria bacterium]
MKFSLALVAVIATVMLDAASVRAADKIITVGTAGVTGVYYPAGGAVCRLMNRGRKEHGFRCAVESTGGSIHNLEAIRKGDLDVGVVQSDMLYNAYNGTEIFSDVGADQKLRILFSLHPEPFTVVARKDAKIINFDDLKGKRVSLGSPGSGMRATMEDLMKKEGWTEKTFSKVVDIKSSDLSSALCGNEVDAIIYAGGHPNGTIQQLTGACETRLVNVSGPVIDEFIASHPFYSYATIPGGMYNGNPKDVKTFGVKAVLVANEDLGDDVTYEMVKSVFERLDDFKTLHPVFATLNADRMVRDTDITPYHEGALRYFKEKGLVD